MDTAEIWVVGGGIALSLWVLWFFFGPRASEQAAVAGGVQTIKVRVQGGYSPDRIEVKKGEPVRLLFTPPGKQQLHRTGHLRRLRRFQMLPPK